MTADGWVLVRDRPRRAPALGRTLMLVFFFAFAAFVWALALPKRDLLGMVVATGAGLFALAFAIRFAPSVAVLWRGPDRLTVTRAGIGWPRGKYDEPGQVLLPWSDVVGVAVRGVGPEPYRPGAEATAVLDALVATGCADDMRVRHAYRVATALEDRLPYPEATESRRLYEELACRPGGGPDRYELPPWSDVVVVLVALRPEAPGRHVPYRRAVDEITEVVHDAEARGRHEVARELEALRADLERWLSSWASGPTPHDHRLVVDRAVLDLDDLALAVARTRPGMTLTRLDPAGPGALDAPPHLARIVADIVGAERRWRLER